MGLYSTNPRNRRWPDTDWGTNPYNPLIAEEEPINKYKQALDEIEEIAKCNNFLVRDPFCGTGYRDLSGQILSIIKRAKEK